MNMKIESYQHKQEEEQAKKQLLLHGDTFRYNVAEKQDLLSRYVLRKYNQSTFWDNTENKQCER